MSTFREEIQNLGRDQLLEILLEQDPELVKQVNRIEYVFKNKLNHLNWDDGSPIVERPVTDEELALIIDEPFEPDHMLTRAGLTLHDQRQLHVAKDAVLWAKYYMKAEPRVYQILMLRYPSKRKILRAGRRLGKALAIDTPIPTVDGWKTMGDIQVGDILFDENGDTCKVNYVTDFQYGRKCYDVCFSDGSIITADADHLWTTHTKQYRKALGRTINPQSIPTTLTTEEIRSSLRVGTKNEANHAILVASPVNYPHRELPINPYTLGAWLGDGVSREASISIHEKEMALNIIWDGYDLSAWKDTNMYTIHGISAKLKQLDVLNNKHIPELYLTSSIEQRQALLEGLMDTDGSVRKEDGYCEISFKLEALAKDTYELAASLGLRPTLRIDDAKLYGKLCGKRHRVGFTPNRVVFRLQRKVQNQKSITQTTYRYITDIKDRESVPVKCIEVDSSSSLFLAGKNYIPTHNTWTLAVLLLHYSFTHNNGKCIVVAPMKAQVGLIFDQIIELADMSAVVKESIVRKVASPQYEITFSNGSTIRFFTSGVRSGGKADVVRGQEAHIIVLDELDYMHNDDLESLYAMLQQTSANQADKLLIGASTPTGRRETFWRWAHSPRFKEFWFPSLVNPYITKEEEDEFLEEYTEMGYAHEILADWGEDAEGVYSRKYIDIAFNSGIRLANDKDSPEQVKKKSDWDYIPSVQSARSFHIIGVDWDKYGAGTNIVVLEVCAENYEDPRFRDKMRVCYREEIPKGEYTLSNGVERIIELNQLFDPRHIYVDRGNGEVQVELLHKYGLEHPHTQLKSRVKGIGFGESIEIRDPATKQKVKKELKPFMVDNLCRILEQENICFAAHDEELYLQLISYVVLRTTSLGRPIFEAAGSAVDHAHDALILACYAYYENYGELMRQRYARHSIAISGEYFQASNDDDGTGAPVRRKRALTVNMGAGANGIRRRSWR